MLNKALYNDKSIPLTKQSEILQLSEQLGYDAMK